jgi:carboxyl-terminal processing protease
MFFSARALLVALTAAFPDTTSTQPSPPPCAEILERARGTVARSHWSPAVRVRADDDQLADRACARAGNLSAALTVLLDELGDPAVRVLTHAHFDRTLAEWDGVPRVGIGLSAVLSIDVDETTRRLTVILPIPESPASRAGLRTGDVMTAIEGVRTDSLGLTRSIERLRVPADRAVRLTILRNDEARDVVVRPTALPRLTALSTERRQIDGRRVLVLRFDRFTPGVADELRTRLTEADGVDAVLLDLRRNPGGRLDELAAVAGSFLPEDTELARSRGPEPFVLRATGATVAPDVPLAVLVSRGSASAAEVLASALRAHGRARIYGEQTFGKGLVHRAIQLVDDRWVLMLPVGDLETRDGRRILAHGIEPDVRTVNPMSQAVRDLLGRSAAVD